MKSKPSDKPSGFTLVELLVVIGIIAVLISILLPVIGSARATANAVACQSNVRQIALTLLGYATDNKGQFPAGFSWANATSVPSGGVNRGMPGGGGGFLDKPMFYWQTIITARINGKGLPTSTLPGLNQNPRAGGVVYLPTTAANDTLKLSPVFDCAAVDKSTFNVQGHYQGNPAVMPNIPLEYNFSSSSQKYGSTLGNPTPYSGNSSGNAPNNLLARGALRVSDLYSDTALLWETNAAFLATANGSASGFIMYHVPAHAYSMIDAGRLVAPNRPHWRYRYRDILANSDPDLNDPNMPIFMPTDKSWQEEISNDPRFKSANGDLIGDSAYTILMGNARFRHSRNTTCMVGFADGSVRGLKINMNRVAYQAVGLDSADSEFLRKYLLVKPQSTTGYPARVGF